MAAATDYSGWVRELDSYQQQADDGEADDPRLEVSSHKTAVVTTSRAGKSGRPVTSQAEELQQEMKLLNWHKLANEAALKAAIIKTSKIKKEDAQFAGSLTLEEREERAQRMQQVVEEKQLRPLEVNSEFFRDFEAKGQRDEAKLEDDVQRHIQHLRRLKETMAQKEDAQRRRRQYRERVQELNPPPMSAARSVAKRSSNQEEDALQQQQQRQQRTAAPNNVYQRIADAQLRGGRANAEVVGSLDKLMELEKRIRHLEDAGLGVDALDGGQEQTETGHDANTGSSNVRFAKRKSGGGPHEPSRTVYAVKPAASKARAKDALIGGGTGKKPVQQPATAKKRGLSTGAPGRSETFLTSLPESKQRQMRRMTKRERRGFLKNEKASEAKQRALKQDVVIDGWLDKKRQAAAQRKAASLHVRTAGTAGKPSAAASNAAGRRLTPPPKVRAPAVGAASGKRISALNPHMQRFDDLKRGFDKRKEMLQRPAPSSSATAPRTTSSRAVAPDHKNHHQRGTNVVPQRRAPSGSGLQAGGSRLNAGASLPQQPPARRADGRSSGATGAPLRASNAQVSLMLPTAPSAGSKTATTAAARPATKLPSISRVDLKANNPSGGFPTGGPSSMAGRTDPKDNAVRAMSGFGGVALPRIAVGRAPLPSPPPAKNPNVPQFSRLHKR